MDLFIEGIKNDIKIELPEIEKFFSEYRELNSIISNIEENKYDEILTNYSTEDLKFSLGFLSSIYKNIESKGFKIINAVFDAAERYGEYEISVFYGNRILEKYTEKSTENILIRVETLRRVLGALIQIDDKLFFINYLIKYSEEIENLLTLYPSFLKEIYSHISDWYQFVYFYSLSIQGDNEKALGFLLKSYEIRKYMLKNGMTDIITGNTILYIANILGLYSQLEDSPLSITFHPDDFIAEFVEQTEELKLALEKHPARKEFFLKGYFRKYFNELLTNVYVLGYHQEHSYIVEMFPEIINRDHLLMVKIDSLFEKAADIEREKLEEEIKKIKDEMDIVFNNIKKEKQEQILYLFYNLLIEISGDIDNILNEILEKKNKKFKDSLLFDILRVKGLIKKEEREKAYRLALETKEKAIIQNNRFIINAIDRIIKGLEN